MAIQKTRQLPVELVENLSAQKGEPDWMLQKRLKALDLFEELPVPRWWHTDVRDLKLEGLTSPQPDPKRMPAVRFNETLQDRADREGETSGLLIQHNSRTIFRRLQEQFTRQGVLFTDLDTALQEHGDLVKEHFMTRCVPVEENKFVALHAALWSGGVLLYLPRNVEAVLPFEAHYWLGQESSSMFEHVLIIAERGSRLTFVEKIASDDSSLPRFHNAVVEIFAGEGSQITFASTQLLDRKAVNFNTRRAVLDKDASVDWFVSEMGGKLSRVMNESVLEMTGSRSEMKTIFFGTQKQHIDIECSMKHIGDHSWSDILSKGVLADKAVSVYHGTTDIKNGSANTKTFQTENTLLLSDEARSNAVPGLYIEENELEGAGHAATVGKVDEEQLFYLRSRGIPEVEAVKLIVKGFLDDMLRDMPLAALREEISELIDRKLAAS